MKKLAMGILAAWMILAIVPSQSEAANETIENTAVSPDKFQSQNVNPVVARLVEIGDIDEPTLDRSEKKELSKEDRTIKNDQIGRSRKNHDGRGDGYNNRRHSGRAIYFMGGGALLIILLIILLI